MLTGELRNQIDRIWDSFWSGGIANPIEVIEQITYLLFLKRLDDEQTREDKKALTLKKPVDRRFFPEGADEQGIPYDQMRWQHFKNLEPRAMFDLIDKHVFPYTMQGIKFSTTSNVGKCSMTGSGKKSLQHPQNYFRN